MPSKPLTIRTALALAIAALVACATLAAPLPQQAPPASARAGASGGLCDLTVPGRVVAIGDVHGAFDQYTTILRDALLIDGKRRWIGGNAWLVQVGDVLDRGAESRQVLDMLRRLESEAAKAGGGVLFLLGNHEVMRMVGDLRYVSAAEYKAFQSADATDLRERLFDYLVSEEAKKARAKGEKFDARAFRKDTLLPNIPLGSVEMQVAFSESGEYGPWLRTHAVMARINGIAFAHGGPSVAAAALGCAGINARVQSEIKTIKSDRDPTYPTSLIGGPDGPLWFRGLVEGPPVPSTAEDVTAVLKSLGASRIVVGHTVSPTFRILSHFDGRVFQIDTGMLGGDMYPGGGPSALEIKEGTFTAIYPGRREVLK